MIRKRMIIAVAATTVFTWMLADSQDSQAQLLRRLRQRIQQRAYVPPQSQPRPNQPFGQPSLGQPGTTPNGRPSGVVPNYNDGSSPSPSTPDGRRRVSPVDPPATPAPVNSSKPNDDETSGATAGKRAAARSGKDQVANRVPVDRQPTKSPGQAAGDRSSNSTNRDQALGQSILESRQSDSSRPNAPSANGSGTSAPTGKPRLGVEVVESRQGVPGLRITGVKPGLGAQRAGLVAGDLIVAVDGQPIRSIGQVSQVLAARENPRMVQVQVIRNRRVSTVAVPVTMTPTQLAPTHSVAKSGFDSPRSASQSNTRSAGSTRPESPRKQPPAKPATPESGVVTQLPAEPTAESTTQIGLRVEDVNGKRGAKIIQITTGSPAAAAGLKAGDLIVGVNGRLLLDAPALDPLLRQADPQSVVDLRVVRGETLLSAKVDPNRKGPETTTEVASDQASSAKNSPLQSVGAVLGGLFGGQKSSPNRKTAAEEKPEEKDDLALGDDDPIQQVDFESDVTAKNSKMSQPEQESSDASGEVDPLSLDALRLPVDEPTLDPAPEAETGKQKTKDSEPTKQQLQDQIERLKKQIKEFQEKK